MVQKEADLNISASKTPAICFPQMFPDMTVS